MRSDRHGRSLRPDVDPRRRPSAGLRVRTTHRFARCVDEAIGLLSARVRPVVGEADLSIHDLPPLPPEDLLDPLVPPVPLVEFRTGQPGGPAPLLTLYRRPLESRARDHRDLREILVEAISAAVADSLGWEPDEPD